MIKKTLIAFALIAGLSGAVGVVRSEPTFADKACEGALSVQYPNKSETEIKHSCNNDTNPNDSSKKLSTGLTGFINKVVDILIFLIGAISVIMIIVGGIRYVVSGGDSNAVTGAKNTILYAIVGLVVAIMAYAIVNFVLSSL